ncbi:MAG: hypothetical protein ACPG4T_12005, partial [Nannocystaceae bacterium]
LAARLIGEGGVAPDQVRIVDPGERLLERWRGMSVLDWVVVGGGPYVWLGLPFEASLPRLQPDMDWGRGVYEVEAVAYCGSTSGSLTRLKSSDRASYRHSSEQLTLEHYHEERNFQGLGNPSNRGERFGT